MSSDGLSNAGRDGAGAAAGSEARTLAAIKRFYEAEGAYMNASDPASGASFDALASTLDEDVVLHQSPDLPWGGEFYGHAGYEDWAKRMSRAFDSLVVEDARFFVDGDTAIVSCRLVTRSRATGTTLDEPMAQVIRVVGDKIIEFRPFYWNVPAYCSVTGTDRHDMPTGSCEHE